MKFSWWLNFLHKWVGLIIGLQIVAWVLGGVVMTIFPIEIVRGEHNIRESAPPVYEASDLSLPLADIVELYGADGVSAVTLRRILGQAVYDLELPDGQHVLADTGTGARLSLTEDNIRALAQADFAGEGEIAEIAQIDAINLEYRGAVPVWRVRFNDEEDTRLYLSPLNGRVMARRNATWRLFDFFWMLHIMDYKDRVDFNNPLVIIASIVALVTVLMGMVLLIYTLRPKDWRFAFARRRGE